MKTYYWQTRKDAISGTMKGKKRQMKKTLKKAYCHYGGVDITK